MFNDNFIRIIPCLDINNGQVVKGVNFVNLQRAGDPIAIASAYDQSGADELCFLDISASIEQRKTMLDLVRAVAKEIFIPFTVGGGVSELQDVRQLLLAGADKVAINSAALKNPQLIADCSQQLGSQCIVAAIDVKKNVTTGQYQVFSHGGRVNTERPVTDWVLEVTAKGAGEILLTSMDKDGTGQGFDLELLQLVRRLTPLPLIASGGGGSTADMVAAAKLGATGLLAASIFHFGQVTIPAVKNALATAGFTVRKT